MDAEQDLFIDCDHDVLVTGARKRADGTYLNAGTATWALLTAARAPVDPAATGPLTFVAASNGNYAGVIDKAYTAATLLTPGRVYYVKVVFSDGGYDDTRYLKRVATLRGRD